MSADSPNIRSKSMLRSWKRAAVISGLAVAVGLGVARLVILQWNYSANEPERQVQSMILAEKLVKRGLLITAIRPSSRADRCGLRAGDIIVRYGEASVEDITSYVTAAEQQSSTQPVTLTVFRNGNELQLTAPPGYLGFLYEDWNPTRKQIYERLAAGDRKGATELASVAEGEGSLTEVQSLIVKILLIPNRSSKEKEQQRAELLERLMSRYPIIHIFRLAQSEFFRLNSFAAAARCYEEQLARFDKDDVGTRLNLALSYASVFEFDQAEYNVRYVVDRPNPGLSPHGVFVAHEVCGVIALGRNRQREALRHLSPYVDRGDESIVLMCLLAAAKLGDLDEFHKIRDRATAASTENLKRIQFEVDTLNAYALSQNGKQDEAAALVLKWGTPNCIIETASAYWDKRPGGDGIAECMRSLVKTSS